MTCSVVWIDQESVFPVKSNSPRMLIYIGKYEGVSIWGKTGTNDIWDSVVVDTEYTPLNVPHMLTKEIRIGTVYGMSRYGENVYFIGGIFSEAVIPSVSAASLMSTHKNLEMRVLVSFNPLENGRYREVRKLETLTSRPDTYELMEPFHIVHTAVISDDVDIQTHAPVVLCDYIRTLKCADSLASVL